MALMPTAHPHNAPDTGVDVPANLLQNAGPMPREAALPEATDRTASELNFEASNTRHGAWVGRGGEIRQMQRWLAMARAGQPRSILILGDEGVGKTTLVHRVQDLLRQQDSPVPYRGTVVSLSASLLGELSSPEASPASLLASLDRQLVQIADAGIRQTQDHINDVLAEAQIVWTQETFEQAFRLMQETLNPADIAPTLEAFISQSIPMLKRWRVPVSSVALEIARLIQHPWVQACQGILWPETPPSQNVDADAPSVNRVLLTESIERPQTPEISDPSEKPETPILLVDCAVNEMENLPSNPPAPERPASSAHRASRATLKAAAPEASSTSFSSPSPDTTPDSLLLRQINTFTGRFISLMQAAQHIDGMGFLWLDDWDVIATLPYADQQQYRSLLKTLMTALEEARTIPVMLMVSARSTGSSTALGGDLFGLFRNRLLLAPLSRSESQKLISQTLETLGLDADGEASQDILHLTQGNPLWLRKTCTYLAARLQQGVVSPSSSTGLSSGSGSSQITQKGGTLVTSAFVAQQGFERASDLLELAFTTLRFQFFESEQQLLSVLKALLDEVGTVVFSAQSVVERVAKRLRIPPKAVFEVIRELYAHGFVIELERAEHAPPRYQIADRVSWEFLHAKAALMQDGLPASDRLGYLKKILPFALKSGELTREKTQEILQQDAVSGDAALRESAREGALLHYLEGLFTDALTHGDTVAERVTALMNLTVLETPAAWNALIRAFSDSESLVREYAARIIRGQHADTLLRLTAQQQLALGNAIGQALDDEDPCVRQAAVAALWSLRESLVNQTAETEDRPAMPILMAWLLDCLDDEEASIREVACVTLRQWLNWQDIRQHLSPLESSHNTQGDASARITRDSALVVHRALLNALQDESAGVVTAAALCLQLFPTAETVSAIADVFESLASLPKATLTALADTLARCELPQALEVLLSALTHPALPTPQRMVIVRAIANRPDAVQAESTLLKLLANLRIHPEDPEIAEALPFIWVCVQSLGRVAFSETAVNALNRLSSQVAQHEILQVAIRGALRRIQARMERFRLPSGSGESLQLTT